MSNTVQTEARSTLTLDFSASSAFGKTSPQGLEKFEGSVSRTTMERGEVESWEKRSGTSKIGVERLSVKMNGLGVSERRRRPSAHL